MDTGKCLVDPPQDSLFLKNSSALSTPLAQCSSCYSFLVQELGNIGRESEAGEGNYQLAQQAGSLRAGLGSRRLFVYL